MVLHFDELVKQKLRAARSSPEVRQNSAIAFRAVAALCQGFPLHGFQDSPDRRPISIYVVSPLADNDSFELGGPRCRRPRGFSLPYSC